MPELLDRMPHATVNLAQVSAAIQRRLFDALKLTIRVENPRRAHVHITLTEDTPPRDRGGSRRHPRRRPRRHPQPPGGTMDTDLET